MKTTNTIKQWMKCLLSMLLVIAGSVIVVPTASADDVTATVFSAPGWDYANIRPGPSTDGQPIGKVQAGQTVQLDCYRNGGEVKGPYGSSTLWYKIKGYDSGWVADAMLSTGSDLPVTSECETPVPVSGKYLESEARGRNYVLLLDHYFTGNGETVVLPWGMFWESPRFIKTAYSVPVGGYFEYEATEKLDTKDLWLSLHKFSVTRTSQNCFYVTDYYDFDHNDPNGILKLLSYAPNFHLARRFDVVASGCYSDTPDPRYIVK